LVELLTVITIIGILAAIIIPVAGRVRNSARAAQCQSNVRQIGQFFQLFAADNKNALPTIGSQVQASDGKGWSYALLPYHFSEEFRARFSSSIQANPNTIRPPGVFACPGSNFKMSAADYNAVVSDYVANSNLLGYYPEVAGETPRPIRITEIASPSQVYLVTDGHGPWRGFWYSSGGDEHRQADKIWNPDIMARHREHFNMLFADGSVKRLKFSEIRFYGHPDFPSGGQGYAPWGPRG
jgi:prepilin-type processing-associated H-X9-DG protein